MNGRKSATYFTKYQTFSQHVEEQERRTEGRKSTSGYDFSPGSLCGTERKSTDSWWTLEKVTPANLYVKSGGHPVL